MADSPWLEVLNTNYAPSDDEASRIRQFCRGPEQDIGRIDSELERLKGLIQDLDRERQALVETVDPHHALLSPIRRLSPELLQQIFAFCLPQDRNPVVHHSECPLLLGRVCSLWRRVADATPQLWSAIHLVIPSSENATLSSLRTEAMRVWLGRAGITKLHISLHAHLPVGDVNPFVEYLARLSHRWASASLDLPMDIMSRVCTAVSGNIPQLHTLHFRCLGKTYSRRQGVDDTPDYPDKTLQFMLVNPSIRHLSVKVEDSRSSRLGGLLLPPDPSHLESLVIDSSSILFTGTPQILDLLSALPELKKLQLRCSIRRPTANSAFSIRSIPVLLDSLKTVSLGIAVAPAHWTQQNDEEAHLLPELFDNLILPRLEEMDFLSGYKNDPEQTFTSFTNLLARSAASLQKLGIKGTGLHDGDGVFSALLPVLEASPQLKELTLMHRQNGNGWGDQGGWGNWTTDNSMAFVPIANTANNAIDNFSSAMEEQVSLGDQVFKELSSVKASVILCPKLEKLCLLDFPPAHLTENAIKSFLAIRRSRLFDCELLQALHIGSNKPPSRDVWGWPPHTDAVPITKRHTYSNELENDLSEFRKGGMVIDIQGGDGSVKWVVPSTPWLGITSAGGANNEF